MSCVNEQYYLDSKQQFCGCIGKSVSCPINPKVLKYVLLVILVLIVILPLSARDRKVRIGVYDNKPKVFITEDGKPAGIFIDVIHAIASQEDWDLEYVPGTWDEGLKRLEKGEIDLMPDVAFSSEREKLFSFHRVPVLSSWSQVFARRGSGIASVLDLNGMRIAVLEGSIQKDVTRSMIEGFSLSSRIITYPDFETAFVAVRENEADLVVTNNLYGLMNAPTFGLEDTSVVFNPSVLFFAADLGKNAELLSSIDSHLTRLKKDHQSEYYVSLKRWTSEKQFFKMPLWAKLMGLIFLVAVIVSALAAIVLKHQVRLKTKALRKANIEMENRILERTFDLEAAMEKAKEADELKSAFLATMSHELRTPLNSIIGFTGILLQQLAGPLNEEQKKQLSMVQKSSRHLLSLINDVLDISKIEAGQLELSYGEFELRASLMKLVELIRPLTEKKHLELRLDFTDCPGCIYSDERRLEQIVLNLMSNAVKFTEHGYVELSCFEDNGKCHIQVKDSGIGIDQNSFHRIFEPFSQAETGLARKYEGTGLGLSI